MKRLVMDTSGIRAANEKAFAASKHRYEFLIDGDLYTELYTHIEKNKAYSKTEAAREAHKNLKKTEAITAYRLAADAAIQFELEEGKSARGYHYEEGAVPMFQFVPSDPTLMRVQKREMNAANILNFKHPPECEDIYQELRSLQGDELWPRLADLLNSDIVQKRILDDCVTTYMCTAKDKGWKVSNNFCPGRDWLTFGGIFVALAYMGWKYARYGDDIPQPDNPANPGYDMIHVTHMAICDGIFSNDNTVLNIAWACWPEKRDNLMTYDTSSKALVPYRPNWQG